VFAIQEEIAEAIAARLGTPVRAARGDMLVRPSTRNLDAYNLYLLGRYYWNKRNETALKQAIVYFERAAERDPSYALAYTGVADVYNVLPTWSNTRPKPLLEKAKKAALKALSLDDTLAEAHASLGFALQHLDWDWEGSEREFQRAIELNCGYSVAHLFYSSLLRDRGLLDAAFAEMRRAREADPISPLIKASEGLVLYQACRYVEALEEARQNIQMNPEFFPPHRLLGMVHIQQGGYAEAIDDLQEALRLQKDSFCLGRLGYAYARAGRNSDATECSMG
jgi:tetratricopeptide (TPR) repeat protein